MLFPENKALFGEDEKRGQFVTNGVDIHVSSILSQVMTAVREINRVHYWQDRGGNLGANIHCGPRGGLPDHLARVYDLVD